MKAWRTANLSDIASTIDYGHTASADAKPVGPKFLRITDIQKGRVDWDTVPFCSCDEATEAQRRLVSGDIVFARTGATTGKSFLIRDCPERAVFASYLIRVRAGREVLPAYLAHFFRTPQYWSQISRSARGAAQAGVNATSLGELSVPIAPLAEQRRIAAILDAADALRQKRRQALELLDQLSKSIFIEMFGDPRTNPRNWGTIDLGTQIKTVTNGLTRRAAAGDEGGQIVLRLRDIRDGYIEFEEPNRITLSAGEQERYQTVVGDLLFVRVNGNPEYVGRNAVFRGNEESVFFNDHIMRVRFEDSKLEPTFASFMLNSPHGRSQIALHRKTSAGQHTINQDGLSRVRLPLPPIDLQRKFADAVIEFGNRQQLLHSSEEQLDTLFASLQQRAFRGEL